jgi:uncharacterized membrane protein YidH (DUF202 family)
VNRPPRPTERFDVGLQHERTALAWERTSIAMMTAGIVFARFAATNGRFIFSVVGLIQVALGAAVLVWAGAHYEDLHGRLRDGRDVIHPVMAKAVGLATVALTGIALVVGVATVI